MYNNRDKFVNAVKTQLEPNIFNHSLSLEACMGGLYDYLEENGQLDDKELPKEDWMLAGLIHDIDFSGEYKEDHPTKTKEVLAKYNLEISDEVHKMVLAHAHILLDIKIESKGHWAIFCADSLTGLITAVAFVIPTKKLADVKLSSVIKRFLKEPRFAAGTRRDEVAMCSKEEGLNMPLEKFIEVCLLSMQKIASDIGL